MLSSTREDRMLWRQKQESFFVQNDGSPPRKVLRQKYSFMGIYTNEC